MLDIELNPVENKLKKRIYYFINITLWCKSMNVHMDISVHKVRYDQTLHHIFMIHNSQNNDNI